MDSEYGKWVWKVSVDSEGSECESECGKFSAHRERHFLQSRFLQYVLNATSVNTTFRVGGMVTGIQNASLDGSLCELFFSAANRLRLFFRRLKGEQVMIEMFGSVLCGLISLPLNFGESIVPPVHVPDILACSWCGDDSLHSVCYYSDCEERRVGFWFWILSRVAVGGGVGCALECSPGTHSGPSRFKNAERGSHFSHEFMMRISISTTLNSIVATFLRNLLCIHSSPMRPQMTL